MALVVKHDLEDDYSTESNSKLQRIKLLFYLLIVFFMNDELTWCSNKAQIYLFCIFKKKNIFSEKRFD